MKIYAISDLHLSTGDKPMDVFGGNWQAYEEKIASDWKERVDQDDVVLVAGDLCWAMKIDEAQCLKEYLSALPGTKVVIRGNHDYWWQSINGVRSFLPKDCRALQNDAVKIGQYIFCGSRGWTAVERNATEQDQKLWNRELLRMKLALDYAKKIMSEGDKIICLIHFPPFNSNRDKNELMAMFEEYGVSAVVYGHIHGRNSRADKLLEINGIKYYLTSCDQVDNKLVEILA